MPREVTDPVFEVEYDNEYGTQVMTADFNLEQAAAFAQTLFTLRRKDDGKLAWGTVTRVQITKTNRQRYGEWEPSDID